MIKPQRKWLVINKVTIMIMASNWYNMILLSFEENRETRLSWETILFVLSFRMLSCSKANTYYCTVENVVIVSASCKAAWLSILYYIRFLKSRNLAWDWVNNIILYSVLACSSTKVVKNVETNCIIEIWKGKAESKFAKLWSNSFHNIFYNFDHFCRWTGHISNEKKRLKY